MVVTKSSGSEERPEPSNPDLTERVRQLEESLQELREELKREPTSRPAGLGSWIEMGKKLWQYEFDGNPTFGNLMMMSTTLLFMTLYIGFIVIAVVYVLSWLKAAY